MEINAETLIAIGGLITGVLGAVGALIVSKRSAKKDEVSLLREEIARLQKRVLESTDEVEKWRKRYNSLFNYMLQLRTILANNGIAIPILDEESGIEEPGGDVRPLTVPKESKTKPTTRKEPKEPEK